MEIRRERLEDFDGIYRFVKEAFATARVSDGTEQDYVNRLRASKGYIPELALVAEEAGDLAGYVMLTRQSVALPTGEERQELLLAPLAVACQRRGQGIGRMLTREALRRAEAMGYSAVFLVGDWGYYGRLGFLRADGLGIANENGVPGEHFLACPLREGALEELAGGRVAFGNRNAGGLGAYF